MTDLILGELNEYKNLSRLDDLSFDELLKTVTTAITEIDNNLREVVSNNFQLYSFSLRCLATGNTFANLKYSLLTY